METISSSEAARRLGEIFARASRGEHFLVTQYGRPYVQLGPPEPEPAPTKKSTPRRKQSPATAG